MSSKTSFLEIETITKIVADNRAKFFAPYVTDAQRREHILRDVRTTFGKDDDDDDDDHDDEVLWPLRRVVDSPFMFLEDPTAEGFGLGLCLDADAEESRLVFRAEVEDMMIRSEPHRRSIAACATANARHGMVLFSSLYNASPALFDKRLVTRGLHSEAELDALYAQITELFPFEFFAWYFEPFETIENVPDEVIFRILSYLPPHFRIDYLVKTTIAGRAETTKKIIRSTYIGEWERYTIMSSFVSNMSMRITDIYQAVVTLVGARAPDGGNTERIARAEFLNHLRPLFEALDIGFGILLPQARLRRGSVAYNIFVFSVDSLFLQTLVGTESATSRRELTETEREVLSDLKKLGRAIYNELVKNKVFDSMEKIVRRAIE